MSNPTDTFQSAGSTTETEMRLRAAMENARLKKNSVHKRPQLINKSTSENALSTTEMRLKEAMEIASLKAESNNHQGPKKSVNVFSDSASVKSISKNKNQKNIVRKNVETAGKTSEQNWLARQVAKLFVNLSLGKRSAAK